MIFQYLILFFLALVLSAIFVPIVQKIAFKFGFLDIPGEQRKIHSKPTPLLGGWAIFSSAIIVVFFYLHFFHPNMLIVPPRFYWGIFFGGLVLMIGGGLDDKYNLPPSLSFLAPAIATLIIIFSGIGIGITQLSNPFGHPFNLQFMFLGIPFSAIFIFIFILGMIYTTKFLDGMDGLTSGISLIASATLFFLSLEPQIRQSVTASLSIIFAGALAGFLIYNFNPASIFLGESGSTICGFFLGVLSVLLGGKIATAILVMGIPILDVAWVIVRRAWYHNSPFQADRKHLHFRLLDIGFSQKQTVLILYLIAIIFGSIAIFLQSLGKLIALVILLVVMLLIAVFTVMAFKRRHPYNPEIDQTSLNKFEK